MITYRTGDASRPRDTPVVIAHIVNDVGAWGAGFTRALTKTWGKTPERAYRNWHAGRLQDAPFELGQTLFCGVKADAMTQWVAHLLAQHGIGRGVQRVDYAALQACLHKLAAGTPRSFAIAMPRIGTGLGGGRWEDIEPLIQAALPAHTVVVYDLPTETPK